LSFVTNGIKKNKIIRKFVKNTIMPLKSGRSRKVISENVRELSTSKPSAARAKAIKTIAKKEGITPKQAKVKQAVAISYSQAKKK